MSDFVSSYLTLPKRTERQALRDRCAARYQADREAKLVRKLDASRTPLSVEAYEQLPNDEKLRELRDVTRILEGRLEAIADVEYVPYDRATPEERDVYDALTSAMNLLEEVRSEIGAAIRELTP